MKTAHSCCANYLSDYIKAQLFIFLRKSRNTQKSTQKRALSKQAVPRKAPNVLKTQLGIMTAQLGWCCPNHFSWKFTHREADSRKHKHMTTAHVLGEIQVRGG